MPWGDGTGPWGLGPMTGRAAGYCAGYPVPGYANWGVPRFGGRGRGFRRMYYLTGLPGWARFSGPYAGFGYAAPGPAGFGPLEDEEAFLQSREKMLEAQLNQVRSRLKELSEETNKSQEK